MDGATEAHASANVMHSAHKSLHAPPPQGREGKVLAQHLVNWAKL